MPDLSSPQKYDMGKPRGYEIKNVTDEVRSAFGGKLKLTLDVNHNHETDPPNAYTSFAAIEYHKVRKFQSTIMPCKEHMKMLIE
ncbi:hypothetical protein CHS0354_029235 [Potamilus streckersoni]|uniref:Uncharacterized protein n=1 Tax=Potamilus streckersoni TaxID=2493646 RepID=A0AAE0RUQ2_9BIVA|nr:hypothetical protein CHS0354_029235 [Potamilus streckersoni]